MNDLAFVSTFTGGGGLDLGLERAGIRIAAMCESDAKARGVLKRHWPDIPCHDDVRTLRVESTAGSQADGSLAESCDFRRADAGTIPAGIDGICGGVPCQDVSVAGKRKGLAGERTGLFFDFARVADESVRPGGWLLFENVPGLLSSNGGRDFAVILATLAEIGFHDLAWRVLNSRYFGVPQNRRRVFIVARRSSGSSARAVLLEPEGGGGDFEAVREARKNVAATLTSGSARGGVSRPGRLQEDDVSLVTTALDTQAGGADDNEAQGNQLVVKCLTTSGQRNDTDTEDFVVDAVHATQDPITSENETMALTANADIAVRQQQRVRRLTPLERERLQGFPDGWTILPETLAKFPGDLNPPPDAHRNSITGNAVTTNVAEWIGRRIVAEELANPMRVAA